MTRILIVLALGLIVANSLCSALCAVSSCRPAVPDSGACHHSESPDPAAPCAHAVMWRADTSDPSPAGVVWALEMVLPGGFDKPAVTPPPAVLHELEDPPRAPQRVPVVLRI